MLARLLIPPGGLECLVLIKRTAASRNEIELFKLLSEHALSLDKSKLVFSLFLLNGSGLGLGILLNMPYLQACWYAVY